MDNNNEIDFQTIALIDGSYWLTDWKGANVGLGEADLGPDLKAGAAELRAQGGVFSDEVVERAALLSEGEATIRVPYPEAE